jgi:hypothetical protein
MAKDIIGLFFAFSIYSLNQTKAKKHISHSHPGLHVFPLRSCLLHMLEYVV